MRGVNLQNQKKMEERPEEMHGAVIVHIRWI